MENSHLLFNTDIGSQKPENIIHTNVACPFCDRENLEGIIERRGNMLLVKNKYPVLEDAFQTVLIETDQCNSELSLYPKEHLYRVMEFGLEKWLEMKQNTEFKSVIFYKNHGPYSGGTIRHPHMQIVGLKHIDCQRNISMEMFKGIFIDEKEGVELNLSTKPKVGFTEFNVRMNGLEFISIMADYIQQVVRYILNDFHKKCNSYNIFFYKFDSTIIAKIMPRFVTSPLFIGYSIPHVSNKLTGIAEDIRKLYFNK